MSAEPDLGAIVRARSETFLRTHPTTAAQRKALRAISACRTPALGGQRQQCDRCGHEHIRRDTSAVFADPGAYRTLDDRFMQTMASLFSVSPSPRRRKTAATASLASTDGGTAGAPAPVMPFSV